MYLLGYDIGSSSIKAVLLDAETGEVAASASAPADEMHIDAPQPGWAEQDPGRWWEHLQDATTHLRSQVGGALGEVRAVGLSYQMHGLVLVDRQQRVLRPSIIWCDSRAVEIGKRAFQELGAETCLECFLNSPGNFTASKLRWVREHEPDLYARIHKAMLPGDYIAMKLTGRIATTPSGLSEGILWDVQRQGLATDLLDYYEISPDLLPEVVPTFAVQGRLSDTAAQALGLAPGTPVAYRAGDQPNNALSLGVLQPGELAATAGTSGVVYGVSDRPAYDPASRVNIFLHVNHTAETPRYGTLLCVNGTGILNRWLRQNVAGGASYEAMNEQAARAPVGSEGLIVLPFGNGAERVLEDRDLGASVHGLNFNVHGQAHLLRAAQEGIVFALNYGIEVMREMDIRVERVKAGHANLFLSPLFAETFATMTGATVELLRTDGAQGAARGAGIGAGLFAAPAQAFDGLERVRTIEPNPEQAAAYRDVYASWRYHLDQKLQRQEQEETNYA